MSPQARHGTMLSYRRGCRCSECRQANADYFREWAERTGRKQPTNARIGSTVDVDVDRIERIMLDHDMGEMEDITGVSRQTIYRMRRDHHCGYYTLDKIACSLGMHPYELMAGEEQTA